MENRNLVKDCVALYRAGGSRKEAAHLIMEKAGIGRSAAFARAKNIWENEFDEDYVPLQQRREGEEPCVDTPTPDGHNLKQESGKFEQKSYRQAEAESKSDNVRTLDELLRVCEVDANIWEVERHIVNKWEVAAKDKSGQLRHSPLYQVKAWLKRKLTNENEEVIKYIKEEMGQFPSPVRPCKKGGKYLYEISAPDLHLAKMAWAKETGYENYDIKIAAEIFREAVYDLLGRVNLEEVKKVLLPVGNDFFNSEGLQGMTTAGTPQQDDSRWQKSFQVGHSLITNIIDDISKKVDVDVVIVQGNHDYERDFYLGEYLQAWYRNSEAVNINNEPTNRKYYIFGDNLILFTHGNEEKQSELPLTMATECEDFSRCKFRRVHLGHLHQDWLREYKGVKVRVLPSLCPPDSWHAKKAFVGAQRSAMGFLYDPKYGEIQNNYFNVV
jgi:predicted phosphodiesterase